MIEFITLCMRRMTDEYFNRYDELLPQIMYSLNNTKHPATNTLPHELMFGWLSLISADLKRYHDQPLNKIEVLTNIKAGETDDKLTKKVRDEMNVNDKVLIKNHNPNDNINQKFKPVWTPGYVVKKIINNCYYVAPINVKRGRHKRVHIQDIKKQIDDLI